MAELPNTLVRADDELSLFRDLETGMDSMGTLKNAYDIVIEEEVNGEDTLTFKLPILDRKRMEIGTNPVEMIAKIAERYYVVKEIKDKRDDDGKMYTEFTCESRWTELRDWYVNGFEAVEVDARMAMLSIFNNIFIESGDPECDWTVGNVEIMKKRTLRSEWTDVLSLLHEVQNTWGGELLFDTKNKIVHLVQSIGHDAGIRFEYSKNLKTVERNVDTYDIVTRIYPKGKDGLDIKAVNNNVPYLQNTQWVDALNLRKRIIPYLWVDERYTDATSLKEDAQTMLDEMARPSVSYATSVHDLSALTGHEHEFFELGDIVTVVDKDLFETEFISRVVRRKEDVRHPENTEVELGKVRYDIVQNTSDKNHNIAQKFDEQTSFFQDAIENATDLITGNLGGHVIFRPKNKPEELLIMDTDSVDTAKRVWRWNLNGLGYSTTGVNGPFNLAMTSDGAIVADFITVGVLRGIEVNGVTINGGRINGASLHISNNGMDIWLDNNGFHMKKDDFDVWIDGSGIRALKNGVEKMRIAQDGTISFYGADIIGDFVEIHSDTINIKDSDEVRIKLNSNGMEFYQDGVYLGNLSAVLSGGNQQKGISLNLEKADFLSFDEPDGHGSYQPMFETLRVPVDGKRRGTYTYLPFFASDVAATVRDYGAKGDGVTDDTAAFQQAIDENSAKGLETVVPDGTYKINMLTGRSHMHLKLSAGATILAPADYIIDMSGQGETGYGSRGYDVLIEGGRFKGNLDSNVDVKMAFTHVSHLTFRNVIFDNAVYNAHVLDLMGCDHVVVDHCLFYGFKPQAGRFFTEAVQLDSPSPGNPQANDPASLDNIPTYDVTIKNCEFHPIYNSDGSIRYPAPNIIGNHAETRDNAFYQIYVENNLHVHGVDAPGDKDYQGGFIHLRGCFNFVIKNNRFLSGVKNYAINIYSNPYAASIDGNEYGPGDPNIQNNFSIVDNYFEGFGYYNGTVSVQGTAYNGVSYKNYNFRITGNQFGGESDERAISLIIRHCESFDISGNAFRWDRNSLDVRYVSGCTITHNKFLWSKSTSIIMWESPSDIRDQGLTSNNIISENIIDGSSLGAIWLRFTRRTNVTRNIITRVQSPTPALDGACAIESNCSDIIFSDNIVADYNCGYACVITGTSPTIQTFNNNVTRGTAGYIDTSAATLNGFIGNTATTQKKVNIDSLP